MVSLTQTRFAGAMQIEVVAANGNGLDPGTPVGHADYPDFRAAYVGPGRRPGLALVKVAAGWSGELPAWPVSVPYQKLVEVT